MSKSNNAPSSPHAQPRVVLVLPSDVQRAKATVSISYLPRFAAVFAPIDPYSAMTRATTDDYKAVLKRLRPTVSDRAREVKDFVGQGRTFSAFMLDDGLVVKFTCPFVTGNLGLEEAAQEALLYAKQLRPLQGTVVPGRYRMLGSPVPWEATEVDVYAAILEYGGLPMTEARIRTLTVEEKWVIVGKYRQLHAAGVVHVSAQPKHWLLRRGAPVEDLKLIDFGTSRFVEDARKEVNDGLSSFIRDAEAEIRRVCEILGLQAAHLRRRKRAGHRLRKTAPRAALPPLVPPPAGRPTTWSPVGARLVMCQQDQQH